jgi:hypothetical protein
MGWAKREQIADLEMTATLQCDRCLDRYPLDDMSENGELIDETRFREILEGHGSTTVLCSYCDHMLQQNEVE